MKRTDRGLFPFGMRRFALLLLLGLSWASPGRCRAEATEISVTPTGLEQHGFVFALTSRAVETGAAIHITIGFKEGTDLKYATTGLAKITPIENDRGKARHWVRVPGMELKVTKGDKGWTIDFIAPKELPRQPDVYFIFTVHAFDSEGRSVPSADFYEMRLADFVNEQSERKQSAEPSAVRDAFESHRTDSANESAEGSADYSNSMRRRRLPGQLHFLEEPHHRHAREAQEPKQTEVVHE